MSNKKEPAASKLAKVVQTEAVELIAKPKKTLAQIAAKLNARKGNDNKIILAKNVRDIEVIPSGVVGLDYILRIGGWPRGKMGMISGAYSSWKSTICLRTIAEAQKRGGTAAYVDAEYSFDKKWAAAHGVDLGNLLIYPPTDEEDALDTITSLINDGVDVIILDSLVALAPKKELYSDPNGKEIESVKKEVMGVFAKKMSQWCRANVGRISKNNTLFIVINQLRDNITGYGNPTTIPGGNAVKFYSSFMIEARKVTGKEGDIIIDGEVEGSNYSLKASKLKVGKYGGEITFAAYGSILDNYTTLRDLAIKKGVIEMPNNKTYVFGEHKITGKDKVRAALISDPIFYEELYKAVFDTANISTFDPFLKQERAEEIDENAEVPELSPEEVAAVESIEPDAVTE